MKRVFDGLSLVALGVVLLACTTGFLSWTVWISILSLWPLLLVSAGLDIIGNATDSQWLRALSGVIFIVGLFYGAFVMQPGTWGMPFAVSGASRTFDVSVPRDAAATEGGARVNAGATRLAVRGGSGLAAISGNGPADAAPTLRTSVLNGRADVAVDQVPPRVMWGTANPGRLDVTLDRSLRWMLFDLNAGAAQADIDLRELEVERLNARTGASQITVTFGEKAASAAAEISAGAASITLRVPRSARVNLKLSGALTSASVPPDFARISGIGIIGDTVWTGAGAGPTLNITVKAGLASLTVERY